jgi:hypothetical protein
MRFLGRPLFSKKWTEGPPLDPFALDDLDDPRKKKQAARKVACC